MTRQEKYLVFILRWWIVLFIAATIGFIVFPNQILEILGTVGHHIFGWTTPGIGPSTEKFWLVLAISMMVILITSAIKAQANIVANILYVKIIIIAKLASTIGFIAALILSDHAFAYLAGAVVDGSIMIITWFAYHHATSSRFG